MSTEVAIGTAWHSPGSIYAIGHAAVVDLLKGPVQVQEKVDGSYFAFGLFPEIDKGEGPLRIRSKGAPIYAEAPPAMFRGAVDTVKVLTGKMKPGYMYRGEVLAKPKHNTLAYDRIPTGHVILHDICTAEETFLNYEDLAEEAARLGLEVVPQLGTFPAGALTHEQIVAYLKTNSILGKQEIEGVVIKPIIPVYGLDKKFLMAKFVSPKFKEAHSKVWGESNPAGKDIIQILSTKFNHPGRWLKALQHLKEEGKITSTPQDIGLIIREVPIDVLKEEADAIKAALFKWAWPHISRGITKGLPEWYKEQLLEGAFETVSEADLKEFQNDAPGG